MKNKENELLPGLYCAGFLLLLFLASSNCGTKKNDSFIPEIGVCTSLSNSRTLASQGYSYIEENVGHFLVPFESDEKFDNILSKVQKSAIPVKACNSFIPSSLKSVGPDAVHIEILGYMETAFRRAQKAGVEHIVFGSGGSRTIPDGFPREEACKQFINLCSAMAPIAAKYDVIVVLEPLNSKECNFINSVSEGGEIVEKVDHPNFRLLADIYHMLMDNEAPESIIKYGSLIKHTHVAEKEGRAAPGTHDENFRPYLEALKKVGYKGRMSVECNWENLESQSATAINTIRKQM